MTAIVVPDGGRPRFAPGSDSLVGVDGNVFAVLGTTAKLLRRAGATPDFVKAYQLEATRGDYDHAVATSMAYLDAEDQQRYGYGDNGHRFDPDGYGRCRKGGPGYCDGTRDDSAHDVR